MMKFKKPKFQILGRPWFIFRHKLLSFALGKSSVKWGNDNHFIRLLGRQFLYNSVIIPETSSVGSLAFLVFHEVEVH